MPMHSAGASTRFDRASFSGREPFTCTASGSLGAKARGLACIKEIVEKEVAPRFEPALRVEVPLTMVIGADAFDLFVERNELSDLARSDAADQQIAAAFSRAVLPDSVAADLRAFLDRVRVPLAVRSSSLLEDAVSEPFAGVYATKMVPNSRPDLETRVQQLAAAVKQVYGSVFFRKAKDYRRASRHSDGDEKMAVMIQEVIGTRHDDRFYPHLSGVARSFNFYPIGIARPEDGIVELGLGLGRIIVNEGIGWAYSPACPQANPPYNAPRDLVERSQKHFWAIDLHPRDEGSGGDEVDCVRQYALADAERDGTLVFIASTYLADDDRIVMGTSRPGPRIVDFAPILRADLIPLTALLQELLKRCREALGRSVEIEFALTFSDGQPLPARFGFLQVRPMVASYSAVEVHIDDWDAGRILAASEHALGNGRDTSIRDAVYLKPKAFDVRQTKAIARELETIDRRLSAAGCGYVLIGFGRWGSCDASAGIPVSFGQISGARVIVESSFPDVPFMPSQGSHFFHNITSSRVLFFSVSHVGRHTVDWEWLDARPATTETEFVRHVRLSSPFRVEVDGRTSHGVIVK